MKVKLIITVALVLAFAGYVCAETFTPNEGNFAFHEVENYTLHGINFTIPTSYELKDNDSDNMIFKDGKNKLQIKIIENGKIKKVNSTKKVKSGKTMLGSVEGYLVDRNGSYTFSYKEGKYLVTIKSKDMPLIIGLIDKN